MFHEVKLGHNASETAANINKHREIGPQVIKRGARNSMVKMKALKTKKVEERHAVNAIKRNKQFQSNIHNKVSDKCVRHLVLALQ